MQQKFYKVSNISDLDHWTFTLKSIRAVKETKISTQLTSEQIRFQSIINKNARVHTNLKSLILII